MRPYIVERATRSDVDHLIKKHYLGKWPGVCVSIVGLLSEDETRYIGVIVFALPPREVLTRYGVKVAWELARLYIEDVTPKNAETWFVSRAIAYVKKTRPEVELLISYSDPSVGHTGCIYRAGNWIADGMTDEERKTPRFDYRVHGKTYSRRKHVKELTDLEAEAFPDLVQSYQVERVPRVSKLRFVYWMRNHERRTSFHAKRATGRGSPFPTAGRFQTWPQ